MYSVCQTAPIDFHNQPETSAIRSLLKRIIIFTQNIEILKVLNPILDEWLINDLIRRLLKRKELSL